jgi:hypothetical protein
MARAARQGPFSLRALKFPVEHPAGYLRSRLNWTMTVRCSIPRRKLPQMGHQKNGTPENIGAKQLAPAELQTFFACLAQTLLVFPDPLLSVLL